MANKARFATLLFSLLATTCLAKEQVMHVTDATIAGNDYMEVINPVWYSVSIYDGKAQYEKDLSRFSKEQRHVFACAWYLAEVNNGGHDQFYFNSTGIVWKDAQEGFTAIGLKEFADLVAESARRLGGAPSFDRQERGTQLEKSKAEFGDLDDRLYELEDKIDEEKKFMEYIRANRTKFYFSGKIALPGP
jgi:hypothetical protein